MVASIASIDTQPTFPFRAAFYYAWYPEAWHQQGFDPFTNYIPTLGFYDSGSQTLIAQHITAMQYAGIQAGIASWWGQGTVTDSRMPTLLQAAALTTFRWSIYYEQESLNNPTVAQLTSDLTYLRDRYGSAPGFLRIDGRFVVFVYAEETDGCGMADRWKQANTVGAYVILKVFNGYLNCAHQPDGWHQYSPANAADHQKGYSSSIAPGFWKKGDNVTLARDLNRWHQNICNMNDLGEPLQLIATFNEWGEGTAVEGAREWASSSGYGLYLDALHNHGTPTIVYPDVISISYIIANPVNLATANFVVIFSKNVTGVNADDFTLTTTGVAGAAVSGVSGSGCVYTVAVDTGLGEGTLRLDLADNNTIVDTAGNPLGGANIGDGNFTSGAVYAVLKSASTAFSSSGFYDGWVLESEETSNVGGTQNKVATTLRLGDDGTNKQYRAILSFNTSSLPDNATITSATLKFKYAGKTGTLPFNTHGDLLVDIRKGSFSSNVNLQLGDFRAGASKKTALTFTNKLVDNWYSQSFDLADLHYISLGGVTQFRLRFSVDDDNDFDTDFLKIFSGNAVAAIRPWLVIEYSVP